MESPYNSHSRSERDPDKKDAKETDKKKEKDKEKSRFENVAKGISELLFGKRERNARVNTENQSFSDKLRELFSSKRVEPQTPPISDVRRERATSMPRSAVGERSIQPTVLAEQVRRRTQEAPLHDDHEAQEQRETRGSINQEIHRPDETLRAKATRSWRQLKLSIREVFSHSRSAETVKQPAQESIQQPTDIESDSTGPDSYEGYSEAPRQRPESRQRDNRRLQEAYYVRERDTSQLAALSVAAILKNRAERREREKLEKEVQELSEELRRQEAIIESERQKTRAMWGEHQRPIERRVPRTDTIQSEINNTAQPSRQGIEASMQPDITPNPVQNTVVERISKPVTNTFVEVNNSHQNITEQTHQSSAQPEITQRQEYAGVEAKEYNSYSYSREVTAPERSPARSVEVNNIVSSPEQLDSRRRFQNQVNATVNQTNDRSVSSKAISPKPRSISDRTSELTQKTKRIYGDSSPASIWTAIIIGWGLFFVVMVWLLRNVFAIL